MAEIAAQAVTDKQIAELTANGCTAEDWSCVRIAPPFDAERFRNVHFSGTITVCSQTNGVSLFGGLTKKTGLYNSSLHNCTIGKDVYINNVENYIANFDIRDRVVIDHVALLAVDGPASFGNGTEARVISEVGGREIPIFDRLSSHVAYILALYRHRPGVIEKLKAMIAQYVASVTSKTGFIGTGTTIRNCKTIRNVKIGPAAMLEGVSLLENGSINSSVEDPCTVGTNVIARNFIFCSGSTVTDGTILSRCFIGQGTHLAKHYSAENSVYFANCGGYHGEACSVFAGPYTVTHHKSTLLIAGLYSFLNAGSGSNQSNHMYKLGPVHQGVVERGSKTTSDSYMLWPARVGPYTLVMGRHYGNSDTSDLPFSYLIEHEDESVCIPGVNLRSVGTVRDARKWPLRDRRKDPDRLDYIIFNLLTPYTVQKMCNGAALLEELKQTSGPTSQHFYFHGVKIKKTSLEKGIRFYRMGARRYLGNVLVKHLRENHFSNIAQLQKSLSVVDENGCGPWLDLAGLLTTEQNIHTLLDELETGKLTSLEMVAERIADFYEHFEQYQWTWVMYALEKYLGKTVDQFMPADIIQIIREWIEAVEWLDKLRLSDARKEFGDTSRIGFGVDGGPEQRDADFFAIRGCPETNDFIVALEQRLEAKKNTAAELIEKLQSL
ncbi:MAG: DUF4954 family protein [Sedimentisphaerales bacterium]|nr:DUF4954 family protein [Sedimentisphaerales bacterium]